MKDKFFSSSGFTLPEVMIGSALLIISLSVILNTYLYSQRYFQAGTAQLIAQGNARKAYRRIASDIRKADSVTICDNYGVMSQPANPGNFIIIDFPAFLEPDVGYYLNTNTHEMKYIADIDNDDPASESDDTVIATNIFGTDIFQDNGGIVSIAFSGFSAITALGYHATDIGTYARPRN